jgi:DNA (cytosine-5)-methyltransferase 1
MVSLWLPRLGVMSLRFIDLFAGIGGTRLAFESAGAECVFTSEWDRFAQATYKANFGDHEIYGDITQIDAVKIPDHDILVGGFPCQPFSLAGVSKKNSMGRSHGFACDTQGTLFFDVARILAEKRPKAFMLENVKNLLSHDKGKTFEIVKRTLADELGYFIDWKVLDAQHFVPQHRERIFIVGFHQETQFQWPDLQGIVGPRLGSVLHPQDGSEQPEHPYTVGGKGRVNDKYVLTDNLWAYLQAYAAKHRAKGNGFGYGLVDRSSVTRTLSARYHKDGSEILISRRGSNPRRLTPREASRLMGFPADWKIPVSDTQAYRQFGNSIVVPLVSEVAMRVTQAVAEMN